MQRHPGNPQELPTRFQALADAAPVMIWMSDAEGRCDFFNAAWLGFTGRSMAEELGEGWLAAVYPDDLERCLTVYRTALETRQPFSMDYRLRRHDGQYRWIQDKGAPRLDESGAFAGFVGSCVDIHEARLGQERIRQSLVEKERLLAEKDFLLKEINHRVKNNLQLVVSLINMRARGARNPEVKRELEQIVNRILALGVGQEQLSRAGHPASINFGAFLNHFAASLRSLHGRAGVELTVRRAEVLLPAETVVALSLIVNELVANAFRHAFVDGRGGTVELSLGLQQSGMVSLKVGDDGIGMPAAPASGFGSGLQIAEVLASQANATLRTHAAGPGGGPGTTVEILIPRAAAQG